MNFTPERLAELIAPLGGWAFPLFVLVYALGTIVAVPGSLLTIAAGLMFGFWGGLAATLLGATLGATGAFQVARTLARGRVERWLAKREGGRLQRIDAAVTQYGVAAVIFLRVFPVMPFNVLNYACGLSGVPMSSYALATAVGIVPGTTAYLFAATVLGQPGASWWSPRALGVYAGLMILLVGLPLAYRTLDRRAEGQLLERWSDRFRGR